MGTNAPRGKRPSGGHLVRVVTILAALLLGLFLAGCGGGDGGGSGSEDASGNAHINEETGSVNGLAPDARTGTPPPPPKVTNVKVAAERAGCYLMLKLEDEGHNHLPKGSPPPKYMTDPPTSGNHVEPPFQQADGAYREMAKSVNVVHSLEHGRMAIQYAPDLSEETQRELKGLYDTMYGGTLLFPNSDMNYAVAATTWTNLLGCTGWEGAKTLDAIRAFGKATWGKYGGEPVEAFGLAGPTPAEPEEAGASK